MKILRKKRRQPKLISLRSKPKVSAGAMQRMKGRRGCRGCGR
jgi:hypothetical protein